MTFAQLKRSIAERKYNIKYKTIDDMSDNLHELFKGENLRKSEGLMRLIYGKNPTIEQINRKLLPHEVNHKCIRSVRLKP